jgi:DNA-binding transcriptional ArsR family regulator
MKNITNKNTPQISGIDALYYFAQSGGGYDNFYMEIINQIEDKKAEFQALNYAYADNDIIIKINDIDIKYSGAGRDGFLWFNHEFFRVGFKDSEKSQNIHNIRVQLNAVGIYTLGIKPLLEYINENFLQGALLNERYFPVTRIDVNMFIQHNFNYLHKEMVLSKKKTHSANISERTSGYELETYYVGKKPFLLRIYNKLKEMENVNEVKCQLMENYFIINGLDTRKPIFNVEFELHREFLKQYGIDTIEDALSSAQRLFKMGCELIKLIDTSSLTEKQINSTNRNRADVLPVWKYISQSYNNDEFMQIDTPLEKIEKISYRYSLEDARKPIKRQIMRLLIHGNSPTLLYFYELLLKAKEDYQLRKDIQKVHDVFVREKSTFSEDLKSYSDEGLLEFEKKLSDDMVGVSVNDTQYDELLHTYNALHEELNLRGLVKFPF